MNCLPRMNVLSPFVPVWKAGLHIREDLKASMRCDKMQPGPYFGRNCWLSRLRNHEIKLKSQLYQSWPPQIWRLSAVPDWNDSFSGCMLLSGYPSSCCQTLRHCWQYRCVHWLIVAGTCSTPLEHQVSRKSMQPQVLGIYIVTLFLVFPHSRTSFHAIRPLFLCCTQHPNWNGTHIEIG